jgi:mannose-6-phosphate isomerase
MEANQPLKISPTVQHYDWGSLEKDSLVAKLSRATQIERPYAELWVGAHPKSSSLIDISGRSVSLVDYLAENPIELLGESVVAKFGKTLPFLFKALSISRALSIQAHPDKDLAAVLHLSAPQHYPDLNHKPEIAIAVTDLEMLYGFRPSADIVRQLKRVRELEHLLGAAEIDDFISAHQCGNADRLLKSLFLKLLQASEGAISRGAEVLRIRLAEQAVLNTEDRWAARLLEQYPSGDRGVFCAYLLNLVSLKAGEAIYSEPNTPHAYLQGELFECMANSDNVVRAGLTSKFVDVKTLSKMLSYEQRVPRLVEQSILPGGGIVYRTPASEFEVIRYLSSPKPIETAASVELVFCSSGKSFLNSEGFSGELVAGDCFLMPATIAKYQLEIQSGDIFRVRVPGKANI